MQHTMHHHSSVPPLTQQRGGTASTSMRSACPPLSRASCSRRPLPRQRSALVVTCYATAPLPARLKQQEQLKELHVYELPTESPVDDHRLRNPLQRHERMSTGWFGVVLEYEGIVVQGTHEVHAEAWRRVAQEFDLPRPLGHLFRRIKGVRDDVTVRRIFNWTQNPTLARDIAARKMAVYDELMEGRQPAEMLEARPFLETLEKFNIPVALACAVPGDRVQAGLARSGLAKHFDAVVTAEDSGAQEVEYYYSFASQRISRPPIRCVVIGESNSTVEAAHELGMKAVVVTGNRPVYDFSGADLVVRDLSQLSLINLKRLFANEDLVASKLEGPEGEEDEVEDDNESLDQQLLGLDDDLPFSGGSAGGSMLATM